MFKRRRDQQLKYLHHPPHTLNDDDHELESSSRLNDHVETIFATMFRHRNLRRPLQQKTTLKPFYGL